MSDASLTKPAIYPEHDFSADEYQPYMQQFNEWCEAREREVEAMQQENGGGGEGL